jgi:hypothetical protein
MNEHIAETNGPNRRQKRNFGGSKQERPRDKRSNVSHAKFGIGDSIADAGRDDFVEPVVEFVDGVQTTIAVKFAVDEKIAKVLGTK